MEVLNAMKAEYQEIVNDIKLYPDHINDYDLVGCMKQIQKSTFIFILKEVENMCAEKNQNHNFYRNMLEMIQEKQV